MITDEIEDIDISEQESIKKSFYSDCYDNYQVNDFKERYILKRVNHSIWFCHGLFHTNNIESL